MPQELAFFVGDLSHGIGCQVDQELLNHHEWKSREDKCQSDLYQVRDAPLVREAGHFLGYQYHFLIWAIGERHPIGHLREGLLTCTWFLHQLCICIS